MWREGDLRGGAQRLAEALDVLADDEPDAEIAELIATLARLNYFLGESDLASQRVERSLEIAEALPAYGVLADSLNTKHLILLTQGRYEEATALLERSIALGREHDLGMPLMRAINNHSVLLGLRGQFAEMGSVTREGYEIAKRLGLREQEQQMLASHGWTSWALGDWEVTDAVVGRLTVGGLYPTLYRANMVIFPAMPRGQAEEARRALEEAAALRDSEDGQISSGYLQAEGLVLMTEGRPAEAAAVFHRAQEITATVDGRLFVLNWGFELEALADAGDSDALSELLAVRDEIAAVERTPYVEALHARFSGRLLVLRGDTAAAVETLDSAVRRFAALGMRFYEAAVYVERAEAGGPPIPEDARATLERLGAKPWLARVDALERAVTV
jgi:tetratricopeptide (TPR) repeat protein